jgi:hypothetical protein
MTYAIVSVFLGAMLLILDDDAMRVQKGALSKRERHLVLFLIFLVFVLVPFKGSLFH